VVKRFLVFWERREPLIKLWTLDMYRSEKTAENRIKKEDDRPLEVGGNWKGD
jgi:hypothetical protein